MKTTVTQEVSTITEPKKLKTIKVGFNPFSALRHLGQPPTDEEMYRRLSSRPGMMKF